jgi:hypothetical protein
LEALLVHQFRNVVLYNSIVFAQFERWDQSNFATYLSADENRLEVLLEEDLALLFIIFISPSNDWSIHVLIKIFKISIDTVTIRGLVRMPVVTLSFEIRIVPATGKLYHNSYTVQRFTFLNMNSTFAKLGSHLL